MDTEPNPPPIVNEGAVRRISLESLLIFLNNNDANCPECGYSLCGIKSANCPECGWIITLRPSDGIDRRRVLSMARWIALMGLVFSATKMLEIVFTILSFGGRFGLPVMYVLFQIGHVVLLVVSVSALIRLRRLQHAPTRVLLRGTKRLSLTILIIFTVIALVPFLLAVAGMVLGSMMY